MIMMSLSLSSGMKLGFKLKGGGGWLKFFVQRFKKIGISILEIDKVVLLALIY